MATLNTRLALRNDSTANWESNKDVKLLKGEVGIEFTENGEVKMKVGDGVNSWVDLPYFINPEEEVVAASQVFQADLTESDADNIAAINRVVGDAVLQEGDTAIVKASFANGKVSHTAYVYDNGAWAAMDGNYNAENVYFDEDMLFTYAFGKYTLKNGNVTIPSAGKNLKELLMSAHVDIKDPTSTNPSFSLSASADISQEVGTTYSLPTATATFTDGTYSYGYVNADGSKVSGTNTKAGITASEISITCEQSSDEKVVSNANSAKLSLTANNLSDTNLQDLIVTDDSISYKFVAECSYPASTRTPTNNVGEISNSDTGVSYSPLGSGSWSIDDSTQKTDTCTISGWRKMFMGTVGADQSDATINSTLIRGLTLVNKQVSTSAQEFTVPVGATKIIVACPEGYVLSKCEYFTMSWEEIALFPHLKDSENQDAMVPVADARGGDKGLKNYHTYVFTHASPSGFEAATKYRVTLKKG